MPARIQTDALVPRRVAYRDYFRISITTGWRLERGELNRPGDPKFPKPVRMGSRWYFRLSEIQKYIDALPRTGAARAAKGTA